jgi:hypothetical protein
MKLLEKIKKFFGIKTKEEKEREKRFEKKLEELRKRDPFIYHNRY